MATLKQDLLRSTFQENQMRLLQSIEENVDRMENRQKTIEDILSDDLSDVISGLRDIGTSIRNLPSPRPTNANIKSTGSTEENTGDTLSDIDRRVGNIDKNIRGSHREDINSREEQTTRLRRDLNRGNRDNINRSRDLQRVLKVAFDTIYSFLDSIGLSVRSLINNSGRVLQDTNSIIKNTGYSLTTVRDFRTNLKDTVDSLNQYYENSELGRSPFNYNDALDLFTTIMNNSGITNMDFYNTYGEMFLKTARSMNVNLSSLATFSDQFYKRYSFSSQSMEDLLSSIRKNTAGTSLSDEELLQLVNDNQLSIASYADSMAQGNQELFDKYLSQGTQQLESAASYLDSLGLDKGQREQIINDLMKASTDISSDEARRYMVLTGKDPGDIMSDFFTDYKSVLEPYIQGYAQAGTEILSDYNMSDLIASNFGYDPKLAKQLSISSRYSTQYQSAQEYEENRDAKVSEDPIMDLWIGYQESMTNKFSTLNEGLAKWQEDTGVDLSFIEQIYNLLKGVFGSLASMGLGQFLSNLVLGRGAANALRSAGSSATGSSILSTLGGLAAGTATGIVVGNAAGNAAGDLAESLGASSAESGAIDASTTLFTGGTSGVAVGVGTKALLAGAGAKGALSAGAVAGLGAAKVLSPVALAAYLMLKDSTANDELMYELYQGENYILGYNPYMGYRVSFLDDIEYNKDRKGNIKTYDDGKGHVYNTYDIYGRKPIIDIPEDLVDPFATVKNGFIRYGDNYLEIDNGVLSIITDSSKIEDLSQDFEVSPHVDYESSVAPVDMSILDRDITDSGIDTVDVNAFDVGAERLLQDQLALVHEGEAIIPSAYNPFDEEKYQRLFNPEIILDSSIIDRSQDTQSNSKGISDYYLDSGTDILEDLYTDRLKITRNTPDTYDHIDMSSGPILDQGDSVVPESSDDTTGIVYTKGIDTPDILSTIERYRPEIPQDYRDQRDSDHREIIENLSEVLKSMNTIYKFLSKWKEDNYTREDLVSTMSKTPGGSTLGISTLYGQTESEYSTF